MKNTNIFVDVDLTLIDSNGKMLDGAREALEKLKAEGCHLFLWSSGGAEYCRKVAATYHLTELFEAFAAKPDIVIDDMPGTCVAPFIYNVQDESSWPTMAKKIIDKHVD
jgi:hypothetical protein